VQPNAAECAGFISAYPHDRERSAAARRRWRHDKTDEFPRTTTGAPRESKGHQGFGRDWQAVDQENAEIDVERRPRRSPWGKDRPMIFLSAPFLSYLAWMLAAIIICAFAAVQIAKAVD
jgi:hypothetical protein